MEIENINDYLYKYGLHDCEAEKIYVKGNSVIFCFNTGVYYLDETGKETTKTPSCLMLLEIEGLNKRRIWEYVEIYRIKKKEIRRVSFGKFIKEVDKYQFGTMVNYISTFNQSILLDGGTLKNYYFFVAYGVNRIEFKFMEKVSHK